LDGSRGLVEAGEAIQDADAVVALIAADRSAWFLRWPSRREAHAQSLDFHDNYRLPWITRRMRSYNLATSPLAGTTLGDCAALLHKTRLGASTGACSCADSDGPKFIWPWYKHRGCLHHRVINPRRMGVLLTAAWPMMPSLDNGYLNPPTRIPCGGSAATKPAPSSAG